MSIHACIWCQVCVLILCVCVCRGVRAFAIYFSEWVAKQSYASCVSVRPLSVCWLGLHVCAGASWSVSWLALDGELEESRGERGDLQKRHAPLPPLLLFLLLLLLLCLALPFFSSHLRFQSPSSSPTFTPLLSYSTFHSQTLNQIVLRLQKIVCVTERLSVLENKPKRCIKRQTLGNIFCRWCDLAPQSSSRSNHTDL